MMSATNPLISIDRDETLQNASESLDALVCLLGESPNPVYQRIFSLLCPISHALEYAVKTREEAEG